MSDHSKLAASHQPRSFSPASPPDLAKPLDTSKSAVTPRAFSLYPTSPPSTVSGPDADALHSSTPFSVFTPPTSAPMSAEPSQQAFAVAAQSSLHYDLQVNHDSTTSNAIKKDVKMSDEPAVNESQHTQEVGNAEDRVQNGLRRTDHDREGSSVANNGNSRNEIDWSKANGPYYRLHEDPPPAVQPLFSQNFFDLYGLNQIAASVARRDPITGEKKRTRKSYQNYIKDLSGKNKPDPKPQGFLSLLNYPDEEWNNQSVKSKELEKGLSASMLSKLDRAVRMAPGQLPKDEQDKWGSFLANEDAKPPTGTLQPPSVAKQTLARPARPGPSPHSDAMRPSRRGTKRRYHEDSFEGYGEGYADDGRESPGGDDDDDDRGGGSGKKKRRKDTGGAGSRSFAEPLGSYSANTISLGGGSYSSR